MDCLDLLTGGLPFGGFVVFLFWLFALHLASSTRCSSAVLIVFREKNLTPNSLNKSTTASMRVASMESSCAKDVNPNFSVNTWMYVFHSDPTPVNQAAKSLWKGSDAAVSPAAPVVAS